MIISKAPTRITFAGGATDARPYYEKRGGFLVAAGIDKYIWMIASKPFQNQIRLKYSQNEEIVVTDINEIGHPLFRETLKFCGLTIPIELTCLSDVPPNCGLGTSSAFTVSLLKALSDYLKYSLTQKELADMACCIEIEILGKPIGKQDQYMSALGGLTCLTFDKDGSVEVGKLEVADPGRLKKCLGLYDTGQRRSTNEIQSQQYIQMRQDGLIPILDEIKDMAYETKRLLENGQFDDWGNLLNDYWQTRKKMSDKISLPIIDEAYELALQNGALGGKVIGAGGGGFLMMYCPNKPKVTEALSKLKFKEMPFNWDYEGVRSYSL